MVSVFAGNLARHGSALTHDAQIACRDASLGKPVNESGDFGASLGVAGGPSIDHGLCQIAYLNALLIKVIKQPHCSADPFATRISGPSRVAASASSPTRRPKHRPPRIRPDQTGLVGRQPGGELIDPRLEALDGLITSRQNVRLDEDGAHPVAGGGRRAGDPWRARACRPRVRGWLSPPTRR